MRNLYTLKGLAKGLTKRSRNARAIRGGYASERPCFVACLMCFPFDVNNVCRLLSTDIKMKDFILRHTKFTCA